MAVTPPTTEYQPNIRARLSTGISPIPVRPAVKTPATPRPASARPDHGPEVVQKRWRDARRGEQDERRDDDGAATEAAHQQSHKWRAYGEEEARNGAEQLHQQLGVGRGGEGARDLGQQQTRREQADGGEKAAGQQRDLRSRAEILRRELPATCDFHILLRWCC
jgi:hypothetical protein